MTPPHAPTQYRDGVKLVRDARNGDSCAPAKQMRRTAWRSLSPQIRSGSAVGFDVLVALRRPDSEPPDIRRCAESARAAALGAEVAREDGAAAAAARIAGIVRNLSRVSSLSDQTGSCDP